MSTSSSRLDDARRKIEKWRIEYNQFGINGRIDIRPVLRRAPPYMDPVSGRSCAAPFQRF